MRTPRVDRPEHLFWAGEFSDVRSSQFRSSRPSLLPKDSSSTEGVKVQDVKCPESLNRLLRLSYIELILYYFTISGKQQTRREFYT